MLNSSEHDTHNTHKDSALLSASLISLWNSFSSVCFAVSSSEGIIFLARDETSPPGRTVKRITYKRIDILGHAVVFKSGGEVVPQLLDEIFHHLGDNAAAWYLSLSFLQCAEVQ